jgi:predicted RNA-binding Zn-ribbon protein involved in translation (DUF1610 family)
MVRALKPFPIPSDIGSEMTTIRTTCPRCGEVDMSPEAILLSIRDRAGEGSYRFACPACSGTVEKPADRKVVALLLSAGVELDEHEAEQGSFEGIVEAARAPSEERPGGPPFTVDDLITFHFLLKDDEKLSRAIPQV